jgi:AraC-like DNA-binding protein
MSTAGSQTAGTSHGIVVPMSIWHDMARRGARFAGKAPARFDVGNEANAAFAFGGLTCSIKSVSSSRSSALHVRSSRHVFANMLGGSRDEIAREWWSGRPSAPRQLGRTDESLLVPKNTEFFAQYDGQADYRLLVCEIDDLAFARVLGDHTGGSHLRAYSGPSPIEISFAKRIETFCLAASAFPSGYGDALASLLVLDLVAALAEPTALAPTRSAGSSRFKRVLEFIEEHIERDIRLAELASLAGLSVTHFAHAFKAEHGLSPYRYILQRRINRSKQLLRTTDLTIAAVASRSGFSSHSRFTSMFARDVGAPPSAYRSGKFNAQELPSRFR